MRKNITLIAVFMLLISMVFISCAPEKAVDTSDEMEVYFGYLEAKDVDTTAYTVDGSTTWGSTSVTVQDASKYYWTYKATKADALFKKGETGWTNVTSGAGLGSSISGFSKGAWTFELRAYASDADRIAGTTGASKDTGGQYLFSGSKTTESLTGATNTISIPVSYSYIAGEGTVNFTISTSISQDTTTSKGNSVGTYSISKVEAVIDGQTISLDNNNGTWKGTATGVASGTKPVGLNVYVTGTATGTTTEQKIDKASNAALGTAIVLHGLTTEVTGSAKVTLTAGEIGITFSSTLSGASGGNPGTPDSTKVK